MRSRKGVKQYREQSKIKEQRNMFQMKVYSEKENLNETEISDLCDEEFKIMVVRCSPNWREEV